MSLRALKKLQKSEK